VYLFAMRAKHFKLVHLRSTCNITKNDSLNVPLFINPYQK